MKRLSGLFVNLSSMIIAQLFEKLITAGLMIYLARSLGVEAFGDWGIAAAIIIYFSLFVNSGLDIYGTREIAKKVNLRSITYSILTIRVLLFSIAVTLIVLIYLFVNFDSLLRKLILLQGLFLFSTLFSAQFIFQGKEKLVYQAIGKFLERAFYASLVLLVVHNPADVVWVPVCLFGGVLVNAGFSWYHAGRLLRNEAPDNTAVRNLKAIYLSAFPLGIAIIVTQIFYNFDYILLGFMMNSRVVGYYQAAYQIVMVILSTAHILSRVLLPVFSRLITQRDKYNNTLKLVTKYLLTVAMPIVAGGVLVADDLVIFLFGTEYASAAPVFAVLILSVFTVFGNLPFALTLIADNRQKQYMYAASTGALINIILNLFLIPRYGMMGAAFATIICEITVLGLIMYFARVGALKKILSSLATLIVPTVIMALAIHSLDLQVLLEIAIGAVCYVAGLFLFRTYNRSDLAEMRQILLK
ncbi:MAG: flippase [Calditrichia bacterium]